MSLLGDLADLSQALSAPLIGASLIYAGHQLGALRAQVAEEVRGRRLEATRNFLDLVGEAEVRRVRRWLLTAPAYDPHNLTEEQRADVLRLAVAYDRVGLMLRHDLLDHELVLEWQGIEIVRLWDMVFPVIAVERAVPGREKYVVHFDALAQRLKRDLAMVGGE